ncbi:efflux RND transporter periplasmic adaptor subunit [Myroides sp. M-43]|uniref:efflux RND transporter periplasmic adaptor subunit n=1 Tax=Myroides oncorhynchi TaxID=2893756 RepID=UPI001E623E82|nr:efflux RND transporter periplasmic adaptor subunit [Myroides oncorhynchi]MCC9041243.1 efflux RND transporter periplasmic adaptor subunit [Myroides oncorhynchi]
MKKTSTFLGLTAIALLWACQDKKQEGEWGAEGSAEQYPVLSVKTEKANLFTDYPVVLQGIKDVEMRPKIDGFVEAIYVDEGQTVKKGQPLFKIYAPQYHEESMVAVASIKNAEAELNNARMQVAKAKPLVKEGIISNYELESAEYALRSKEAQLAQSKANLNNAQANVGYTQVVAPFDGVIGLIPYKVGALVSSASAEALTTVSEISSINAYFSMNEKEFIDFMQKNAEQTMQQRIASLQEVTLILANGSEYNQKGKINTVSGQVDPQTGSVNFRAIFTNPQGLLRSGNSATIRVYEEVASAILVPQKATFEVQGKRFVYVVDATDVVKSTEISVLEKVPNRQYFVVTKGLKSGDKIVSADIGGLREGTKIKM